MSVLGQAIADQGRGANRPLSSHLLDEVQRTCDFAAIVDRGKLVVQGSIQALAADGRRSFGTEEPDRAAELLVSLNGVDRASVGGGAVESC
jgi:ABC-2 type transport system ATP-binding protein